MADTHRARRRVIRAVRRVSPGDGRVIRSAGRVSNTPRVIAHRTTTVALAALAVCAHGDVHAETDTGARATLDTQATLGAQVTLGARADVGDPHASRSLAEHVDETPIAVTEVRLFDDGGTVGFVLDDGCHRVPCCLDGRMSSERGGGGRTETRASIGGWCLHVGALHPLLEGAHALPIGGDDERAVATILRDWVDREFDADAQAAFLDHPYARGRSEREIAGSRILRVVRYLEARLPA